MDKDTKAILKRLRQEINHRRRIVECDISSKSWHSVGYDKAALETLESFLFDVTRNVLKK